MVLKQNTGKTSNKCCEFQMKWLAQTEKHQRKFIIICLSGPFSFLIYIGLFFVACEKCSGQVINKTLLVYTIQLQI